MRTSGAVQLRDLAREFVAQGHRITVLTASPDLDEEARIEEDRGVRIVRLHTPLTKDIGYVRRAINEWRMPFVMRRLLSKSALAGERYDGVIWYSPTIFLGPLANSLKRASRCRAYLIVRDIFPEWAVDMGLMGKGPPYWFFREVADYQYEVADVIGVQTPGNLAFFERWIGDGVRRIEILQNWLTQAPPQGCSINLAATSLAGRTILVYAGNMGVAQGMDLVLDLAERWKDRADIGFVLVGRGSDAARLRADASQRGLTNMLFFDEIDPDEIAGLYQQCHIGLVALDRRHKTHNIPGKFLSYMHCGLPALAVVNAGNDLVSMIAEADVGACCDTHDLDDLTRQADALLARIAEPGLEDRCRALADRCFSSRAAVSQIVTALAAGCSAGDAGLGRTLQSSRDGQESSRV
jgi:glycosyltransferase involved in cell wall biosynthesis